MKNLLALFLVLVLLHGGVTAQSMRTIRVTAGNDIAQAYSPNGFYRFPAFGKARLCFNNGTSNEGAHFNYNILSANMQFIGPGGDTLELGGKENLDSVVFDGGTYLFNNGFYEVVMMADSVALLKKIAIRTEAENIGAYGMPNSTAAITNVRSLATGTSVYTLRLNQDVVVTENVSWYFTNEKGNFVKAGRSNLLKILPDEKKAKIEAWLKQNKTNFDKEADLKKLMAAIQES